MYHGNLWKWIEFITSPLLKVPPGEGERVLLLCGMDNCALRIGSRCQRTWKVATMRGNLGKNFPITSIVPAFQVIWLPSRGLPMPLLF